LGTFEAAKKYIKVKPKIHDPRADNWVFSLHYNYTFTILAVAAIMVGSYSWIDTSGSAIQCMTDKAQIPGDVLNGYCWISSTFTLPDHFECEPGNDCLHQGVGPEEPEQEKVYHQYYQWVPFYLAFQAMMFYFPHWLWKQLEGGKYTLLLQGLNNEWEDKDDKEKDAEKKEAKITALVQYMTAMKKHQYEHNLWAIKFYFCEFLNFVNVVFQICLTDKFLGGSFSTYGLEVFSWSSEDPENRVDPMSRVFPRMTKCKFNKFGGSGTIQNFDALCVLGMNIINEKVFLFLWLWFIILAIITAIYLVGTAVTFFVPSFRGRLVVLENYGLRPKNHNQAQMFRNYLSGLVHSEWLILYYLAGSMDRTNFNNLILKMSGSGDTHMEDETDSNNFSDRNDATLPLNKSKSKMTTNI